MAEFRRLSPDFAVAPQLTLEDIARAGAEGFGTIIKNRSENEDPGQPSEADIVAATKAAGMTFRALPFQGPPPPAVVAETVLIMEQSPRPILAYCRSGTRSAMAWGMAQALSGAAGPDEIVEAAARAGYDLSRARSALETLAPKR
ncbi:MAG: TIGR01244 family phosphatase [Proteobacteria bacterium]|nr:TIGR01244 family phosphatase [Pseudomonadota bacterium]